MAALNVVKPVDLSADLRLSARQQELLDDLERVILDEGFRRLTVEQLARRLRCSRRTLYQIAPSRDDLVLLVLDRLMRRMGRRASERVRGLDDPAERLWAYMTSTNSEIRKGSRQLWADVATQPAVRRLVDDHYRYAALVAGRLIDEGVQRGAFRAVNTDLVAEVLAATLERLQDPGVLTRLGVGNAEANEHVFELVLYGLAEHPAVAPGGRRAMS
jgi:AcrR family transcriptional regulator